MNGLLIDPEEYKVRPGPTGAKYLDMMPEAMGGKPKAFSPAALLAGSEAQPAQAIPVAAPGAPTQAPGSAIAPQTAPQPQAAQPKSTVPEWVRPQDRPFFEQARRSGQLYQQSVKKRRSARRDIMAYGKVKNALEREMNMANDLRGMVETYKDLFYEGDAPNAQHMAVLRSAAKHVEAAERLRKQEAAMRQQLKARGVDIPDDLSFDNIADYMEAGDKDFDEQVVTGYANALATLP